MSEGRSELLSDILYSYLPTASTIVSNFLYIPLITKMLGESEYGIWTQMFVSFTLFSDFIILNQNTAAQRFLPEANRDRISKDYHSSIIISLSIAVLFLLILEFLASNVSILLFGSNKYVDVVNAIFVILLFRSVFQHSIGVLKAKRRVKIWSTLISSRAIIQSAVSIAVVFITRDLLSLIASFLITQIAFAIISYSIVVKSYGLAFPDFDNTKRFLSFGAPLIFTNLSHSLVTYSDRIFLSNWTSLSVVGIYAVIYGTTQIISTMSTPVVNVLLPDLSSLSENNQNKERKYRAKKVIDVLTIILIPAVAGISIIAPDLVRIISTKEAAEYSSSVTVLAIGMASYGLFNIISNVYMSANDTRYLSFVWILMTGVNVGVNFLFIPEYGIFAAAASTMLCYIVGLLIINYKVFGFNIFNLERIFKKLIAVCLMAIWAILLKSTMGQVDIFNIIVIVLSSVAIYTGLIVATGVITVREFKSIPSYIG